MASPNPAQPMESPTVPPGGADLVADPNAPTMGDKVKAKAWGTFMAGANLAKAGIKAGIAKGKDLHADLQKTERYQRLKAKLKDAFTVLPVGVQAFLTNPTADTILQNPENLFHVASLLSAINHPERALFEAAVAGSAAVAMTSATMQQAGGGAITGAQALSVAASSAGSHVTSKYVPTQGSVSHAAMTATAGHLQAVRAGQPLDPVGVIHNTAGAHVTKAVNIGTSQAIRAYTGLNVPVNFTQQEVKEMATAIKPQDVQTMLRIMQSLQ